jgi:hypothetical protein
VHPNILEVIESFAAHDRPVCEGLEKAVRTFGICLSRAFEIAVTEIRRNMIIMYEKKSSKYISNNWQVISVA